MAEDEGTGEGGTEAGGMQAATVGVQTVPNTDTDVLHAGGVGGAGGAAMGVAFAFSAEQVQAAIGATEAALVLLADKLRDELLGKQTKFLNEYLPVFATTLATNLAAYVQVICWCVHVWLQTLQIVCVCVCRDGCIVAKGH